MVALAGFLKTKEQRIGSSNGGGHRDSERGRRRLGVLPRGCDLRGSSAPTRRPSLLFPFSVVMFVLHHHPTRFDSSLGSGISSSNSFCLHRSPSVTSFIQKLTDMGVALCLHRLCSDGIHCEIMVCTSLAPDITMLRTKFYRISENHILLVLRVPYVMLRQRRCSRYVYS